MHEAQYHLDLKKSPLPYCKLGVPSWLLVVAMFTL
jgi:hypothetical protein